MRHCWGNQTDTPRGVGGGGALSYVGYVGMCRCEGYGFQAVYSRIGYINHCDPQHNFTILTLLILFSLLNWHQHIFLLELLFQGKVIISFTLVQTVPKQCMVVQISNLLYTNYGKEL